MIEKIQSIPAFQQLLESISKNEIIPSLGLHRAARLPVITAISTSLEWPLVFVVDRMDQAINLADELAFWTSAAEIKLFPEPTPMFMKKQVGALSRAVTDYRH